MACALAITSTTVRDWIRAYADVIAEHRVELVKLDTAIGDGDHGTNMDRGMRQAVEKLEGSDDEDIGALLKGVPNGAFDVDRRGLEVGTIGRVDMLRP